MSNEQKLNSLTVGEALKRIKKGGKESVILLKMIDGSLERRYSRLIEKLLKVIDRKTTLLEDAHLIMRVMKARVDRLEKAKE